jgi:two-component system, NtrC family, sensor histidine kinase KinB
MRTLKHKLWIGFAALLSVLLAVSALTVIVFTRYSHALDRVFHENYDSAIYCDGMRDALDQLNLRAQFLIWKQQAAQQIDSAAHEASFEANLDKELGNISLPGEADLTRQLSALWNVYKTHYANFDSQPAADRAEIYSNDLLPRYQQMARVAQQIGDINMSNMISVDGSAKRTLLKVRAYLLMLVIAGTLLAAGITWFVDAAVMYSLRALTRSAREIEAGNLDLHVPVRSRDEIGLLAEAFNSMSSKLREFRRLDHNRLLRTQQTTQLAIDSLPDAVFIIGPGGVVEISNRTAAAHFSIVPGTTVDALEAKLRWLRPLYDSVKDGGQSPEPRGYRSAVQLFDAGEERYLLPHAVCMVGADNTRIGVAVILVDVTRLRAADEAKSNLVSTVSHELRTPLTAVRMALSLLCGDKFGPVTEKQAALLNAARQDGDRLSRIIENLMGIARMEAGRTEFRIEPLAPKDIISQSVDSMRPAFEEKSIQISVDASAQLPKVMADANAINSALTNLLSNALKFTPRGGRVCVAAEVVANGVAISVADTGPGIPVQHAARVFDKFFRIPGKDGPTGAGLGLAIAKEVVEAHGGMIELCADYHPGARFQFTLPVPERSETPKSPRSGTSQTVETLLAR